MKYLKFVISVIAIIVFVVFTSDIIQYLLAFPDKKIVVIVTFSVIASIAYFISIIVIKETLPKNQRGQSN